MNKINCGVARQIDIVNFLATLGFLPEKIRGTDYWYRSPLRDEKTASFKVNRQKNLWYDHGIGKGGDIIDLGIAYFKTSVGGFLQQLTLFSPNNPFSFHQHNPSISASNIREQGSDKTNAGKIIITATRPLVDRQLLKYLKDRCIPIDTADKYCREVSFLLYDKSKTAIGFLNDAGGYELRNQQFKGSSSPKSPTTLTFGGNQLAVFEGFFDFLSYKTLTKEIPEEKTDFLILNSLAFFSTSKQTMEKYQQVNLFLDRDKQGIECTQIALDWNMEKYVDRSDMYLEGQDLNEWLIDNQAKLQKGLEKKHRNSPSKKGLRP